MSKRKSKSKGRKKGGKKEERAKAIEINGDILEVRLSSIYMIGIVVMIFGFTALAIPLFIVDETTVIIGRTIDRILWPGLKIAGAATLPVGFVLMISKSGFTFDRNRGVVIRWYGVFRPIIKKEISLKDFNVLAIRVIIFTSATLGGGPRGAGVRTSGIYKSSTGPHIRLEPKSYIYLEDSGGKNVIRLFKCDRLKDYYDANEAAEEITNFMKMKYINPGKDFYKTAIAIGNRVGPKKVKMPKFKRLRRENAKVSRRWGKPDFEEMKERLRSNLEAALDSYPARKSIKNEVIKILDNNYFKGVHETLSMVYKEQK